MGILYHSDKINETNIHKVNWQWQSQAAGIATGTHIGTHSWHSNCTLETQKPIIKNAGNFENKLQSVYCTVKWSYRYLHASL